MKAPPEIGVSPEGIAFTRERLKQLSDSELQEIERDVLDQIKDIPTNLMNLSREADRLRVELESTRLMSPLTGKGADDLQRLEDLDRVTREQRNALRVQHERAKVIGGFINEERRFRTENTQYMADNYMRSTWKEQLDLAQAKDNLGRTLGLWHLVNTGNGYPSQVDLAAWIAQHLGDIRGAASKYISEQKQQALQTWNTSGKKQAELEAKAKADVEAGRARKHEEALAFQEKRLPNVPKNTESV